MPTVDGVAADGSTDAGLQVRPVLGALAGRDCPVDGAPEPPGNAPAEEEAALCDLDGNGYRVGPAVAGQEGVEAVDLEELDRAWRIQVTLDPGATDAVAGLAEQAASSDAQVAFVLDGLVLNAGVLEPTGPITSPALTLDAWKAHFDVNFFSLITALRVTLPSLRASEHGGRIIFVSSGAATGNTYGWAPYNASKAAANSLCRCVPLCSRRVALVYRCGLVGPLHKKSLTLSVLPSGPERSTLPYVSPFC